MKFVPRRMSQGPMPRPQSEKLPTQAEMQHYITVLNNNLYLNRVYEAGYASIEVQKAQGDYDFAAQFAKHDVFCNFRFTKALHDRGFFRADARLEAIMSMTAEQFADAMQKEYGHQNYLIGGTA